MGAFESGDDSFGLGKELEALEGLIVIDGDVLHAASVFPVGVFRTNTGVIQASAAGMNIGGLAVIVLQDIRQGAVQNTRTACTETGGVLPEGGAAPAGFDADQLHVVNVSKWIEDSRRIGPATHAGQNVIGLESHRRALGFDFVADNTLEIAHHHGKWMRASDRADDVVRFIHAAHPIAEGFVECVF